jgi:hypothetical protein
MNEADWKEVVDLMLSYYMLANQSLLLYGVPLRTYHSKEGRPATKL